MKSWSVLLVSLGVWISSVEALNSAPRIQMLTHDVEVSVFLVPSANSRTPAGYATPAVVGIQNVGSSTENEVKRYTQILDGKMLRIYSDSVAMNNWRVGEVRDTTFKDFLPQQSQTSYTMVAFTALATGGYRYNDTLRSRVSTKYRSDSKAIAVVVPLPDTTIDQHSSFSPVGSFQTLGVQDMYDMPIRADTTADAHYGDPAAKAFHFPAVQGSNDTRNPVPGSYRISVVARHSIDQDHANDTVEMPITTVGANNTAQAEQPHAFQLAPNFPNPFDRHTTLRYTLPLDAVVRITVRDLLGRAVFENNGGVETVGEQIVVLNMNTLPEGAYVVTLTATEAFGLTRTASRIVSLLHHTK